MERAVSILLNGKEETLLFTTAALKQVQEKYGSISKLVEAFSGEEINEWDSEEAKAAKEQAKKDAEGMMLDVTWWLIATLANQGRLLQNTKAELLTPEWVGMILFPFEVEKMLNACMEAIAKGTNTYHAQEEKERPTDPILEEVEKNGEGAGN